MLSRLHLNAFDASSTKIQDGPPFLNMKITSSIVNYKPSSSFGNFFVAMLMFLIRLFGDFDIACTRDDK